MIWTLYNSLIHIFKLFLDVHSLFDSKSKLAIDGRTEKPKLKPKSLKRIWVHCASLGEFEQANPIIEKIKTKVDCELILTFFSPSGYEIQKDYHLAEYVFYLPFDTQRNVIDFLHLTDPDFIIFVKYEFWWNFIREINNRKVPFIYVSASFRPDQYIFQWYARPFLNELKKLTKIFVIKAESEKLLISKGLRNVEIAGDNRIESIYNRKLEANPIKILSDFKSNYPLLIFGSTYPKEHNEIIRIADDLIEDFQVLIFPHEINPKEINRTKTALGKKCQLYSEIEKGHPFTGYNILIVDKIGFLAEAYQYAELAYIGGGFNNGIHNILEAFVYKIPLVFGPKHEKFEEAMYLKKFNFVRTLHSLNEMHEALTDVYQNAKKDEIELGYLKIFDQQEFSAEKIVKLVSATI